MGLFKKNKKEDGQPTVSDKVAAKIAGAGLRVQARVSDRMNRLLAGLSRRSLKLLLVLFCVGAGGYSGFLIYDALLGPAGSQTNLKIDPVKVPKHFDKTGDDLRQGEILVDESTYGRIKVFKKYMDSLFRHERLMYDSIMMARPGLLDSAIMLEEIYNSQQLK